MLDAEANPGPGTSLVQPDAVWRAHEELFLKDLQITLEELQDLLRRKDPATRALSARLLGHISGREVRRTLAGRAKRDPLPRVRLAALDGLRVASAFPEVCGVLREYLDGFDDEQLEELVGSSIETILKAQRLLETASLITLDPSPDSPPPAVHEGVDGSREAEQIVTEVLEDVTDASGGEANGIGFLLMRPLIYPENRERIWRLGPAAILPLTQRAWGEGGSGHDRTYDWAIAKRLLWDLGGLASIKSMSEIVLTHPEVGVRFEAMQAMLFGNGFFEVWDFLEERIWDKFGAEKDPAVRARAIAYRNACLKAGRASPSDVGTP